MCALLHRTFLQVPFLNLLATVADRAGSVRIRVGGNTQETATLVDSLPDYEIIAKDKEDATNPVSSPFASMMPPPQLQHSLC